MNVSDAIRLKRAVRKFTDQPLPKEVILGILNAGRRAQSSKNTQPWHFIATNGKSTLKFTGKIYPTLEGLYLFKPFFHRDKGGLNDTLFGIMREGGSLRIYK